MPDPLAILFGVAAAWGVGRWISNRRRPRLPLRPLRAPLVESVDWAAMAEREPRGCPCRECGRGWMEQVNRDDWECPECGATEFLIGD